MKKKTPGQKPGVSLLRLENTGEPGLEPEVSSRDQSRLNLTRHSGD